MHPPLRHLLVATLFAEAGVGVAALIWFPQAPERTGITLVDAIGLSLHDLSDLKGVLSMVVAGALQVFAFLFFRIVGDRFWRALAIVLVSFGAFALGAELAMPFGVTVLYSPALGATAAFGLAALIYQMILVPTRPPLAHPSP